VNANNLFLTCNKLSIQYVAPYSRNLSSSPLYSFCIPTKILVSSFTFTAVTWKPAEGSAAFCTISTRRYCHGDQEVWYIPEELLLPCQELWWLRVYTSLSPWTSKTWCSGTGEISFTFISLGRPVSVSACQLWSRVTECWFGCFHPFYRPRRVEL
jgi:hypothetical protein